METYCRHLDLDRLARWIDAARQQMRQNVNDENYGKNLYAMLRKSSQQYDNRIYTLMFLNIMQYVSLPSF